MIKAGGANVSPAEIEVVLMRHPDVAEAIVLGLPDPQRGEIVVAVVVKSARASVTAEALREVTKRALSQYKIPSEFVFLPSDEIPRTHSHKVKKPELQALVAEKLSRSL
jgi:acyl-CoA synthetase (AMP-forming)/AMP-acid ligase II